jgi:hypothetical protein
MKSVLTVSILVIALLAKPYTFAQTFSYDGNRWYEIEVTIFTNQSSLSPNPELFLPEYVELKYPEPILNLTPALLDYSINFPAENNDNATALSDFDFNQGRNIEAPIIGSEFEPVFGPELREPNTEFRLIDKARDPFIALPDEEHEFTGFNRNLNLSSDHRVLFHAVWRQPVLNKVQASAIFVAGGDRYGQHNELEGSLLISYNINRVDVEARIWRNSFNVVSNLEWNVPLQPFTDSLTETDEDGFNLIIDQVYPMLETRQMISNELHYLDHPALGMLIEVRPYELPALFDFSLE